MSDHRRYKGRHARSRSRLRRLTVPLVLVVLATGAGIAWALSPTNNPDSATNSTTVTARSAAPTTAAITVSTTPAVAPRSTRTTVASTGTSTTISPSTISPSTTHVRATSLLQQTKARPDGVAALMDVGMGAGGPEDYCSEVYKVQKPTIGIGFEGNPSVATFVIADGHPICLLGFKVGAPIQVTIRFPSGRITRITAPAPSCGAAGCASVAAWAALPGDPLGRYDVTAVQDKLSAKARITVAATDRPRLMVIGSIHEDWPTRVTVRPGTTIGIALAGLRPRRSIGLLFYYSPSFEWGGESVVRMRFRASTTVEIDASGGAIFRLSTSPTDRVGCYAVSTWPPLWGLNSPSPPEEVWHSGDSSEQFCLRY